MLVTRTVTGDFTVTRRETKVGKYGDMILQIVNLMIVDGAEIRLAKPMMQRSAEIDVKSVTEARAICKFDDDIVFGSSICG